jgi:hypothetical protein
MNLQPLPDSNEADMSAILSEKDLERVGWKFGTRGKRPQPRFYVEKADATPSLYLTSRPKHKPACSRSRPTNFGFKLPT